MSAPKTMSWIWETLALLIGKWSNFEIKFRKISKKIGNSKIKAAPKKLPKMLPTPPIMTINRILNESSKENPSGSTVPR